MSKVKTSVPQPPLGLDIDGCIDEAPIFFNILSNSWPGDVIIITYRDDRQKAIDYLEKFNIYYDELILVDSFEAKAQVIQEKMIKFYFDDQPEMLKNVNPYCNVMLVRNEGNFCFDEKLWLMSNKTGKII